MTKQTIPKAANCDNTIHAVLDDIVQKGVDCIILDHYQINQNDIDLYYDQNHCNEAS